ncbi:hypothetical protein [Streptomyces sp. SID10815]|uniref:hypothetical protein n=1 Tax=Streptomyces sp. SID10815 TaxID=2706027 RepID=UPI0013CD5ADE|nr:hypothetical protein [Streptomyces sp. SID10815]
MRTLRTEAEREEAAVLVQDRQRWLAKRDLPVPARADVPALFRDPQTRPTGLSEDGRLPACLIPERDPSLGRGKGPCLVLSGVHTLPDQTDDATRLITLWASDFAARLGLPLVRSEVPVHHDPEVPHVAAFLRRLTDMGWDLHGHGSGREDDQVAHLELAAEHRSGLSALLSCRVHDPQTAPDDRGGT